MKKLYEASVTAKGGRNGEVKSSDGLLDVKLAFPREMGGDGGATNPEQLFGAAYASCFEQAVLLIAESHKISLEDVSVTAKVAVLSDDQEAFNLGVDLEVKLVGCDAPDKLLALAHAACPYSKAVKGNIPVEVKLV